MTKGRLTKRERKHYEEGGFRLDGRPRSAHEAERAQLDIAIKILRMWGAGTPALRATLALPPSRALARWRRGQAAIPAATKERVAVVVAIYARLVEANDQLDLKPLPPLKRAGRKSLTDCLAGWLQAWPQSGRLVASAHEIDSDLPGAPPKFVYTPVASVRKAFEQTRARAGVPEMTRYSLRHLMASRASSDPRVPEKEIDTWMGHLRPEARAGRNYRHYEPSYLLEAKQFTDRFMVELQQHCTRSLFAPAEGAAGLVPLIPQRERIRRREHEQETQEPATWARVARQGRR